MEKRTLKQAFNTIFHSEKAYGEFCSLSIEEEITQFEINSRYIYKTSKELKKYLRFIDKVILRHLQKNEHVVHSYIKEKNTLTAVKAHAGSRYFFMTDIADFFSNIKTEDVNKLLDRDKAFIPISDFAKFIPRIVKLVTYQDSLPVGFATSPQISNAFLLDFDNELYKYCSEKSLIYTRYSDDIIISANSQASLDEIESIIQTLLWQHASADLLLKEEKTLRTHTGNKVKLLGLVITPNGSITIDSKHKNTIESLLYFYINDKDKFENLLHKELKGGEHSLFGLLHYARSIDPNYLGKLQRKYGAYVLSVLMEDRWSD